jgi:predicted ATPase
MKLIKYQYNEASPDGWHFSPIEMGKVNLIVGDTGSGKTRFLNTIFNLGTAVMGNIVNNPSNLNPRSEPNLAAKVPLPSPVKWKLTFEHKQVQYEWEITTNKSSQNENFVEYESLKRIVNSKQEILVQRTPDKFTFQNNTLPKLRSDSLSVSILKEEEAIRPIYDGFSMIMRRNFFSDALLNVMPFSFPQPELLQKRFDSLFELYKMDLPLNVKLKLLADNFPNLYNEICNRYMSIFHFIQKIEIKDMKDIIPSGSFPGLTPMFCIKEKYIKSWIGAHELSSGMQKVLLILTDIISLPDGALYLIDEYENSLGVTAIDFFPSLIATSFSDVQFIFTSHHPYLINKIPVENWLIFHRKASKVKIRYGESNVQSYGRSKQEKFIQLLNDPFYSEGIG